MVSHSRWPIRTIQDREPLALHRHDNATAKLPLHNNLSPRGGNGSAVLPSKLVISRTLAHPDLNERRKWPDGYTVRPDPADPTRGTLIRANQAEEPEPAGPPLDRPADDELSTG